MPFDLFFTVFIGLFVIVDPFGTAAVFSALTSKVDKNTQRRIALKAVVTAAALLIGFSIIGKPLLEHMNITMSAFRVAGGLLVFVTAFRMIMGFHDPDQLNSDSSAYRDRSDIAIFPLAIPLLAGPGCMTATLMFTTGADGWAGHVSVVAAILAVETIAFLSLLGAGVLGRVFGPTGNSIIARLMGVLLAAMAVQFVADGIIELFNLKNFPALIPDVMQG